VQETHVLYFPEKTRKYANPQTCYALSFISRAGSRARLRVMDQGSDQGLDQGSDRGMDDIFDLFQLKDKC
jgi:hypothetical protein